MLPSLSMNAMQVASGGFRDYAVLFWGIQLAFTLATTVVLAGFAWRLGRPLMHALAFTWGARALATTTLFLYFLSPTPTLPLFVPLSGVYGAATLVTVPLMQWITAETISRQAADLARRRWVRSRWWWAGAGLVIGLGANGANMALGYRESYAAAWTRLIVFVPYLVLVVGLVRPARTARAAAVTRPVLAPLLFGSSVLVFTMLVDSALRVRLLGGGGSGTDIVLSLTNGLAGSLLFGVACIVAAVEAEGRALAEDEQQWKDATVRAAEAQRLQSLGALASGVAHDFNNVLGVVLSGVELAESALDDDPDGARTDLEEVRLAANRGTGLSARLLAFARRQPQSPVVFDLGAAIDDIAPMLERLIGQRILLSVSVPPGLKIFLEPTQFEQMLVNLVINARDAMNGCGHLSVVAAAEHIETERPLLLGALRPGRWLRLTVTDTGNGFDATIRQRLFEPFFTTKGDKGTGLGLATVAAVVSDAGGGIEVESALDVGTRFEIWLPEAVSGNTVLSSS